jgi:hypothetical protein
MTDRGINFLMANSIKLGVDTGIAAGENEKDLLSQV